MILREAGMLERSGSCHPRILVVDDEEIVLMALRETLRQAKYEVVTLADPEAALNELRGGEYSVIISDQRMPGLSGLELLSEARRLNPATTRILITAVLNLDTVIDAINKGEIYRFIVKPWLREEFLATVANGVQRYELLRQNNLLLQKTEALNRELAEQNRLLSERVNAAASQNRELAQAHRELETDFDRAVQLTGRVLGALHPRVASQAEQSAWLCRTMGQILGLPPAERRLLECAARLQDIGLMGVPAQVVARFLERPQTLSPSERALVEQHPVLGQELVPFGSHLEKMGEIIRAHHERWDGGGYPDGLRGTEIPWLSRLLSVAAAWAGGSHCPASALERINKAAGSAFDPEAVRVFGLALAFCPPSVAGEFSLRAEGLGAVTQR